MGYTPIPKPALPADLQDRKRERPIPTKSRTETLAIAIQCAVHVFDLEGRADAHGAVAVSQGQWFLASCLGGFIFLFTVPRKSKS